MKILIVDDSSFMRKILITTVKKAGYTDIIESSDGQEAIEKYKTEKPDIVLLDVIMEKMDGIETLKNIMTINKNAKVIMITAVGQEQMVKEALDSGAKDYIVKPFKTEKIVETIKKVVA